MKYSDFYWRHNDCLNKDTSLAHSFGEKVWNHQQDEIDKLKKKICELEKSEFQLAKVKSILEDHIESKLLESIVVKRLIKFLYQGYTK